MVLRTIGYKNWKFDKVSRILGNLVQNVLWHGQEAEDRMSYKYDTLFIISYLIRIYEFAGHPFRTSTTMDTDHTCQQAYKEEDYLQQNNIIHIVNTNNPLQSPIEKT